MLSRSKNIAVSAIVVGMIVVCTGTVWPASRNWPVFGHDPARSGSASGDNAISKSNIAKLHRQWIARFDAPADATPILVPNVRLAGGRSANMLFETASRGTTYGVDARTGAIIWSFATHGPNITPSTPVSDASAQVIYAPGVDGFVHKLSAATGAELRENGFPVRITWMPKVEKDSSALNLAHGYLYAATSGYFGDAGHYIGHVVTVRLRDGNVSVFNTLCSDIHKLFREGPAGRWPWSCADSRSGIWSRGGAVVDPDSSMHGRVYVTTGNGPFTVSTGGLNYGDSVIALSADGARLEDAFTPKNFDQLEADDTDLGSTAPVMLPRQAASHTPLMAMQGGKDGILRLLNREHLGGVGGEMQDFNLGEGVYSAPAVWSDGKGVAWIYVGTSAAVTALQIRTDASGKSELAHQWTANVGGTSPVVANGLVFAATDEAVNCLDAHTGKLVWSSAQPSAGGTIGGIHWQSPIVAGGWLYVSDETGRLTAYGLH